MKGIEACIDCAHYDFDADKCKRGAQIEEDWAYPFFEDCPLPEAAPVIHARWLSPETTHYMRFVRCSLCDYREFHHTYDCNLFNYCPNCGAKMDGKDDLNAE